MVKRKYNFYHRQALKEEAKKIFNPDFNERVEEFMRTPEFQKKINDMFGYPEDYMMNETNINGGNK